MFALFDVAAMALWVLFARTSIAEPMPQITAAPSGELACDYVAYSISLCEILTPSFTYITDFVRQAPCLCFDAYGDFDPTGYDDPFSNCVAYVRTASPGYYASITAEAGGAPVPTPCASLSDAVNSLDSSVQTRSALPSSALPTTISQAQVTSELAPIFQGSSSTSVSSSPTTRPTSSAIAPTSPTSSQASADSTTTSQPPTTQIPGPLQTIRPLNGAGMVKAGIGLGGIVLGLALFL